MKNLFLKLLNKMAQATMAGSKISSSRVQSFILIVPVFIMILVSIVLEIADFIFAKIHDKEYVISTEFIIIFGMVLSHHLALVFSRNSSQSVSDISGNISSFKNKKTVVHKKTTATDIVQQDSIDEDTSIENN